jgi:hypothetical protein
MRRAAGSARDLGRNLMARAVSLIEVGSDRPGLLRVEPFEQGDPEGPSQRATLPIRFPDCTTTQVREYVAEGRGRKQIFREGTLRRRTSGVPKEWPNLRQALYQ